MTPPTPEDQVKFLTNLQRLLAEGQFVATYKYALLLALADISIEAGDDSGDVLRIPTKDIAEKFVLYYWRQCLPYIQRDNTAPGQVLRQNTGAQAAILKRIANTRSKYGGSLALAQRDVTAWRSLVQEVDEIVRVMPLWKLQTIGGSQFDFLYANLGKGTAIELRPGVAFCLRQFYGLIGDLVRGAWLRYIRRHNHDALGTTADLSEFLFGSERSDLTAVREILTEIQTGKCFYCESPLKQDSVAVDHFIPWSKYPVDLGHNFVLAHKGCNTDKADHLAAADFLEAWVDRNLQHAGFLAERFGGRGVLHDLGTSCRVATWAYRQTYTAGGLTWRRKDEMMPLSRNWREPLARLLQL